MCVGSRTIVRAGYERFHDERTADRGIPSLNDRPFRSRPVHIFRRPGRKRLARHGRMRLTAGVEHRFTRRVSRSAIEPDSPPTTSSTRTSTRADGSAGRPECADCGLQQPDDRRNLFSQTDLNVLLTTGRFRHTLLVGARARAAIDGQLPTDAVTSDETETSTSSTVHQPRVSVPVTFGRVPPMPTITGPRRWLRCTRRTRWNCHTTCRRCSGCGTTTSAWTSGTTGRARVQQQRRLFSPRAGLIVKPIESVSLYTSYSLATSLEPESSFHR